MTESSDELIAYWSSKYVLGLLSISEFPAIADALLGYGYEGAELLMLSLPSEANHSTFEKALTEVGVSLPARSAAERTVARHLAEELLSSSDQSNCLLRIREFRDLIALVRDGQLISAIPSLDQLANCYWAYEEAIEAGDTSPYKTELGISIRRFACDVIAACRQ